MRNNPPVTQRDYYALAGIFLSSDTLFGTYSQLQNVNPSTLIELDRAADQVTALAKLSPSEVAQLKQRYNEAQSALTLAQENQRIAALRDRFYRQLEDMEELYVNGSLTARVPHNLNLSFNYVEGESLIMALKDLAVSSGSACTSASLEPSYVLRALGRSDELAHSSIRFTFGRFTTEEEVDYAAAKVSEAVDKLRELSPLWDMFKEGVDLSSVEWAAH